MSSLSKKKKPSEESTTEQFATKQDLEILHKSFSKLSQRLTTLEAFLFSKFASELADFQFGDLPRTPTLKKRPPHNRHSSKESVVVTSVASKSKHPTLELVRSSDSNPETTCKQEVDSESDYEEDNDSLTSPDFMVVAENVECSSWGSDYEHSNRVSGEDDDDDDIDFNDQVVIRPLPKSKRIAAISSQNKTAAAVYSDESGDETKSPARKRIRSNTESNSTNMTNKPDPPSNNNKNTQPKRKLRESHKPEKRNQGTLDWELLPEEFDDIGEAKKFVKTMDMKQYGFKSSHCRNDYTKYYYNCKTTGCKSKVHFHVPADCTKKISLFKTKTDHNHEPKFNGIHPDTKAEILQLYSAGITKPTDLIHNLKLKNLRIPSKNQMQCFIYHRRKVKGTLLSDDDDNATETFNSSSIT